MTNFTFKDSGVSIQIRRISPLLALELQKQFPPPPPPRNKVVIDDREVWEENLADPDYARRLEQYQIDLEKRTRRLIIRRGVNHTLTEEQTQEVNELRAFWKDTYDNELEGNDLELYIAYIAVGSDKDLEDLIDAILRRSQPTEGEVKEALNSFPAQVS